MKDYNERLGAKIKALRKKRGMTQPDLIQALALPENGGFELPSTPALSVIENGKRAVTVEQFDAFCRALRVSASELMPEDPETERWAARTRLAVAVEKLLFAIEEIDSAARDLADLGGRTTLSALLEEHWDVAANLRRAHPLSRRLFRMFAPMVLGLAGNSEADLEQRINKAVREGRTAEAMAWRQVIDETAAYVEYVPDAADLGYEAHVLNPEDQS